VRAARVSEVELAAVEERERRELDARARRFRAGRDRVPLTGKTAIVVDDGVATGSTARAACQVARAHGAARVVLAVPVGPPGCRERFGADADDVVCLWSPEPFFAVGQAYADFSQTGDDEVAELLHRARARRRAAPGTIGLVDGLAGYEGEVQIPCGRVALEGHLMVPVGATGVVVFAHGSGSSRHSPRNRFVASVLDDAGIGTLLLDLLTPAEEVDRANVFDVELLARRLLAATGWLAAAPMVAGRRIGYFGASTGAAAALWAAGEPDAEVAAVVSRGGRPDLAIPRLAAVRAPTLLIVGGRDEVVLQLNREARAHLRCENDLAVVPGATHLFEEAGTLAHAAGLARDWFEHHFDRPPAARRLHGESGAGARRR
jgi:putative phosphoribosyl transferase